MAFKTLGCRVNQAETDALRYLCANNGFQIVKDPAEAELVIVNSCAVTQNAEAKLRGTLTALRRQAPDAALSVIGCAAYLNAELLLDRFGVRLILGNTAKQQLPTYIARLAREATIIELDDEESETNVFLPIDPHIRPERVRPLLKIQDGCDYYCHYCIVPYLRGTPRSRPMEEAITAVRQLCLQGCHEVVLTGINLGLYQTAAGGLSELVRRILAETDLERLRLSSLEPDLIRPEIIELMAENQRLCPYLHIPLQHGSDRVLQAMGRRYNSADYRALINSIRQKVPEACLGADVMVGYPAESPQDFADMLRFLQQLDINYLHVFRYSPRPFTSGMNMKDSISSAEKKQRSETLIALSRQKRRQYRERFIGRESEVLFEEQISRDEWQGLTANYLPVRVQSAEVLLNQIRRVKIAADTESYLKGELLRG